MDTDVENRSSNYSLTPIDANRDGEDELLLWGTVRGANCLRWVQAWNEVQVLRQIPCQGDCNYMDIVAQATDALPESASNPHAANEVLVVDPSCAMGYRGRSRNRKDSLAVPGAKERWF